MNVIQREFFILGKNPTRNTPQELAIQTQANKNVKKYFCYFLLRSLLSLSQSMSHRWLTRHSPFCLAKKFI